jgi:VanZ family protein
MMRLLRWLPPLVWAAVIFAGSSVPGSQIPGRFSVLGHLGEYAVLGSLLAWALRVRLKPAAIIAALALCALYGASDELHQAFVPMRTPDVVDWATDIVGSAAGIAVIALASVRRRRKGQ